MNDPAGANAVSPELQSRIHRLQMMREIAEGSFQMAQQTADRVFGEVPEVASDKPDSCRDYNGSLQQLDLCLDDLESWMRRVVHQIERSSII